MRFFTRRSTRWSAVGLLATVVGVQVALAQLGGGGGGGNGSVTATIGSPNPNPVAVGNQVTCSLSATATPPTVAYPDQIDSGPTWSWTASGVGNPTANTPDPNSSSATLTATITSPGTFFFSATATATWKTQMGNSPSAQGMTDMVSVTVVGVDKLQYSGPNGYVDISNTMPIYVLVGSTVTFRAVPNPNSASFPAGQPVWSGAASGTGDTISATFNSVATTSITATCGTSYVTVSIEVYDLIPKLTPQDNYSGRDLDTYGVCELIDLSFETNPSGLDQTKIGRLQWLIVSGNGELVGGAGGTTYECSDQADTVVLAIQVVDGPGAGNK